MGTGEVIVVLVVLVVLLGVAVIVLGLRLASGSRDRDRVGSGLEALRENVRLLDERVHTLTPKVGSVEKIAEEIRGALYSPNRRGAWGEQLLTRVMETSGLREGHEYELHPRVSVAGGYLQPDVVVLMPKGIRVVIDSKWQWDSFERAQRTDTDEDAKPHLEHLAKTLLARAEELGKKDYSAAVGGSPRFVLMFVPADPIIDEAMRVRPKLWEEAWRNHNVLIATPGTLLAFLRTVALAWQEHEINEQAHQIADLGKELFDRLRTFSERLQEIGKGLNRAVEAYNTSTNSFRRKVMPQARRFQELGAVARTEQLAEPERVQDVLPQTQPEQ
ncbi:MAG: DNA recombination protein RmuC [Acidimicrobiaceae bacterium]|nr:DNA recombination protein RmuC [Acidimicrobiaceae bacterium]MYE09621.1 DNA recombination protein RmuC [Acidimicrobiaceae bacterium]